MPFDLKDLVDKAQQEFFGRAIDLDGNDWGFFAELGHEARMSRDYSEMISLALDRLAGFQFDPPLGPPEVDIRSYNDALRSIYGGFSPAPSRHAPSSNAAVAAVSNALAGWIAADMEEARLAHAAAVYDAAMRDLLGDEAYDAIGYGLLGQPPSFDYSTEGIIGIDGFRGNGPVGDFLHDIMAPIASFEGTLSGGFLDGLEIGLGVDDIIGVSSGVSALTAGEIGVALSSAQVAALMGGYQVTSEWGLVTTELYGMPVTYGVPGPVGFGSPGLGGYGNWGSQYSYTYDAEKGWVSQATTPTTTETPATPTAPAPSEVTSYDDMGEGLGTGGEGTSGPTDNSTSASANAESGGGGEPVVLDLDRDGVVELVGIDDSNAFYDINGDGYRENVGWVGADDGLLVIDLAADGTAGADGVVDQADEIVFARWTDDPTDSDLQALRTVFDSNQDGVLDASDARFSEFRIWQDLDQDGETDSGELKTLAAAGIASIGLVRTEIASDESEGTRITATASYTRTDALTGLVGDAVLESGSFGFRRETVNGVTTVTQASGAGVREISDSNGVSLDIGVRPAMPRRRPVSARLRRRHGAPRVTGVSAHPTFHFLVSQPKAGGFSTGLCARRA